MLLIVRAPLLGFRAFRAGTVNDALASFLEGGPLSGCIRRPTGGPPADAPGACGKTRVVLQNLWPKPEPTGMRVAHGRACGGGSRGRSDGADVGWRVGVGGGR